MTDTLPPLPEPFCRLSINGGTGDWEESCNGQVAVYSTDQVRAALAQQQDVMRMALEALRYAIPINNKQAIQQSTAIAALHKQLGETA